MTGEDKRRFADAMKAAGIVFSKEPDVPLLRIYWATLAPYVEIERFERAMLDCCARCKFFPRPAEILEQAGVDLDLQWRLDNYIRRRKASDRQIARLRDRRREELARIAHEPPGSLSDALRVFLNDGKREGLDGTQDQ